MPRGQGLKTIFISFKDAKDITLGDLYGIEPIPVSELNKRLWALIKSKNLRLKKEDNPNAQSKLLRKDEGNPTND